MSLTTCQYNRVAFLLLPDKSHRTCTSWSLLVMVDRYFIREKKSRPHRWWWRWPSCQLLPSRRPSCRSRRAPRGSLRCSCQAPRRTSSHRTASPCSSSSSPPSPGARGCGGKISNVPDLLVLWNIFRRRNIYWNEKSTKALGRIICVAKMVTLKHYDCEYGYLQWKQGK